MEHRYLELGREGGGGGKKVIGEDFDGLYEMDHQIGILYTKILDNEGIRFRKVDDEMGN